MRKRSNPDSEQNIKRIDTKKNAKKQTHGFQVHFVRGSSTGTRMFSDAVFGGKEQSRKAARKYRREVMGDLPPRTTLNQARAAKASKQAKPPAAVAAAKKPAAKKAAPKQPAAPKQAAPKQTSPPKLAAPKQMAAPKQAAPAKRKR